MLEFVLLRLRLIAPFKYNFNPHKTPARMIPRGADIMMRRDGGIKDETTTIDPRPRAIDASNSRVYDAILRKA